MMSLLIYFSREHVCTLWPYSERWLMVFVAFVVHAVGLWGSCLFFHVIQSVQWCEKYRLPRPDRRQSPDSINLDRRAWFEQVIGTFVVVPAAVYLLAPILEWRHMSVCGQLPSLFVCMSDFVIMLIGCDFLFYWTHRSLHEFKWLYRNVHKQHHEFKQTNIWASEYFGIIDMILNILPGVLPAVLLGSHFFVLMLFTGARQWQTVQSHAGYNLPFDPLNRGIFFAGAARHDYHHSHNSGCYGDWMPFWDWLCGTDQSYKRYWRNQPTLHN